MRHIQQLKAGFGQWWRRVARSGVPRIVVVAVVALILGISAGTYFRLPPMPETPPTTAQLFQEEALAAAIREQVHQVLQESYPWVLEEPVIAVAVEPPGPERPSPTEPLSQPEVAETVSFEYLIWPAKGEISTPFGWYRHPVYNDWRFNSGIELAVTDELVRTVLPGRVVSVGSDSFQTELVIDHGGGWQSIYRSVEALTVSPGQEVSQNQTIGRAANGSLFFSLSHNGKPVNPMAFLR
ncbi:MAG: M23 family metallopeptidase [Firmicutes bacterium]|jgi:murein DD-endopeptidase MepM/ murein hydrolase activator NlpD|nr:M23 family metallopeptidase [Bacillota bacterium]